MSITWLWHSPEFVCSITNSIESTYKPPEATWEVFYCCENVVFGVLLDRVVRIIMNIFVLEGYLRGGLGVGVGAVEFVGAGLGDGSASDAGHTVLFVDVAVHFAFA